MLELRSISKTFRTAISETAVFADFSLQVEEGEFISIVGSNGSGKSTLLNLVSGLIQPDSGRILLQGEDITAVREYKRARRIGRVFQDPTKGTAPSMTIAENLALAENKNKSYNLTPGLSRKRLAHYRERLAGLNLGLEDKMSALVGTLSGGQRQALALLMSTMTDIDILLLDEHTAALDPKTGENIMRLTDRIIRESRITALMVTHNLKFAVEYGSRILMMDKGRAVVDEAGEAKRHVDVDALLKIFNEISIECGN